MLVCLFLFYFIFYNFSVTIFWYKTVCSLFSSSPCFLPKINSVSCLRGSYNIVCNLASFPPILTIEEKDLKEEIIDRWAEF